MLAACSSSSLSSRAALSGRSQLRPARRPNPGLLRALQPARAFKNDTQGSNGAAAASLVASPDHLRATKMVNLTTEYFHEVMSNGNTEACHKVLTHNVAHKDMVRNEGRYGVQDYQRYVKDLKQAYPDIYVKPTQFGIVDDHTLFVAFEGRATPHTPLFKGVDLILFNDHATKIREIEVYRSNWLGAEGHEERKKRTQQEQQQQRQQQSRIAT